MAQKEAASFQKSVQVPDSFLLYLLTGPWKTTSPKGGVPAPKVGVPCTARNWTAQANVDVSPSPLQSSKSDVYIYHILLYINMFY